LIYVRNNANIKKTVMPKISVVFYQEDAKTVPVLDWLDRFPAKAQDKCRVRIERLRDLGHELRRPETDYLRDGILRAAGWTSRNELPHALFLSRQGCCSSAHGLVKEREVPPREIEEAIRRKRKFELDPERHTYKEG
jgi:hypothetical protein